MCRVSYDINIRSNGGLLVHYDANSCAVKSYVSSSSYNYAQFSELGKALSRDSVNFWALSKLSNYVVETCLKDMSDLTEYF